jgi:hypothetical protein
MLNRSGAIATSNNVVHAVTDSHQLSTACRRHQRHFSLMSLIGMMSVPCAIEATQLPPNYKVPALLETRAAVCKLDASHVAPRISKAYRVNFVLVNVFVHARKHRFA